jgi:hypothetical protein
VLIVMGNILVDSLNQLTHAAKRVAVNSVLGDYYKECSTWLSQLA